MVKQENKLGIFSQFGLEEVRMIICWHMNIYHANVLVFCSDSTKPH